MWLQTRHASSKGLWLKITKRGSGIETVTYAQALDVAPCYGWIDGQEGAVDDRWWLQRFTPRAIALTEAGRCTPPGFASGAGTSRRPVGGGLRVVLEGHVPPDLALDANPDARAFFATLDRTNRYAIPYRIHDAKRPATRARRIKTFAVMLGRGEKPYP